MEHKVDIAHSADVKHQASDVSLRLSTEGMDDLDSDDDILVMVVATRAQERLSKVFNNTSEQMHVNRNQPNQSALDAFVSTKCLDVYSENIWPTMGIPGSSNNFHGYGILRRHSFIGGSMQKLFPQIKRTIILQLAHHSTLAGHPEKRRLYNNLRREYY